MNKNTELTRGAVKKVTADSRSLKKDAKYEYDSQDQFRLINVLIYRDGWTEKEKIDIKNVVVDFDIFESIDSPTLSATMSISDGGNFAGNFPFLGGESVQITFKIPSYDDNAVLDMVIAKVGDRIKGRVTDKFYTYTLQLVTIDRYIDANKQISQAFKGSYSDIVLQSLNELKSTRNLYCPDDTLHIVDFIAPFWSPLKICKEIANRAVGKKYEPFFFFETLDGYNFRSIEQLYKQEPYTRLYLEHGQLVDTFEDRKRSWRKISQASFLSSCDKIKAVFDGAFGSRLYMFDLRTKRMEMQEYDYDQMVQNSNYARVDKYPLYDDIDGRENYRFVMTKSDRSHEGYIYRTMVRNLMNYYMIKLVIPGDSGYRVGQIVELDLPSAEAATSDPLLSGRWFIKEVRHKVVGNKYLCNLTIIKDSFSGDAKLLVSKKGVINGSATRQQQRSTGVLFQSNGDYTAESTAQEPAYSETTKGS